VFQNFETVIHVNQVLALVFQKIQLVFHRVILESWLKIPTNELLVEKEKFFQLWHQKTFTVKITSSVVQQDRQISIFAVIVYYPTNIVITLLALNNVFLSTTVIIILLVDFLNPRKINFLSSFLMSFTPGI